VVLSRSKGIITRIKMGKAATVQDFRQAYGDFLTLCHAQRCHKQQFVTIPGLPSTPVLMDDAIDYYSRYTNIPVIARLV